jgi:hypothetical protein
MAATEPKPTIREVVGQTVGKAKELGGTAIKKTKEAVTGAIDKIDPKKEERNALKESNKQLRIEIDELEVAKGRGEDIPNFKEEINERQQLIQANEQKISKLSAGQ